jgi:hypothetical protein
MGNIQSFVQAGAYLDTRPPHPIDPLQWYDPATREVDPSQARLFDNNSRQECTAELANVTMASQMPHRLVANSTSRHESRRLVGGSQEKVRWLRSS